MSLIGRFEHLPKRPKSDEARPLLEKIASQVKPIMTKRSWKVGILAEFLPSDPSLLGNNMNRGQRINLRLRPPGATDTFYEYDQLVLVMLHELTHNQFGPHDASFYKLLGELEEEYYELKRKGFSADTPGDGFHSDGNKVAGIKRDEYAGRLTGLQAAERRLAAQRKIGKGGVLGGKGTAGRTIREVLAEAVERRIRDDKACSAEGSSSVDEEVRKAAEESVGVDAIDLTGDEEEEEPQAGPSSVPTKRPDATPAILPDRAVRVKTERNPLSELTPPSHQSYVNPPPIAGPYKSPSKSTPTPKLPSTKPTPVPSSSTKPSIQPPHRPKPPPQPTEWSCPICTLLNPIHHLSCDACATERPAGIIPAVSAPGSGGGERSGDVVFGVAGKGSGLGIAEGWFCAICGEGPESWERWSCGGCGVVRSFG